MCKIGRIKIVLNDSFETVDGRNFEITKFENIYGLRG